MDITVSMFKVISPYIELIVAAVDHRKRFVELYVGWPGSVADGRVWSNSSLKKRLSSLLSDVPATFITTKASDTSIIQ
jgi:hypothetical protein